MQHDARSVANELIKRAKDAGESVTPLKIVKLTYFCHEQMCQGRRQGVPLRRREIVPLVR